MLSPLHPWSAVLFDLDGTLIATDRFWPDAARAGALKAFTAMGLDYELPTSEQWMGLVGLPLEEGFDELFAELSPEQRATLLEACVNEEHRLLDEGRAGWLPGVTETLQALWDAGLKIGVASNCSQAYLDAMLNGMGLKRWVHSAKCLDTPGIRNKADMIEELLIEFETRHGVMVGDRDGDRAAAWANGLPHVHLTRGYARSAESVPAEMHLPGMDGLIPVLERRDRRLRGLLDQLGLGFGSEPTEGDGRLSIMGPPAGGKARLAQDLARLLRDRGCEVKVENVDQTQEAIASMGLGKMGLEGPGGPDPQHRDAGVWWIQHGSWLAHPQKRSGGTRSIWVTVDERIAERRIRGGHRTLGAPEAFDRSDWLSIAKQVRARMADWAADSGSLEHEVEGIRWDGGNPLA